MRQPPRDQSWRLAASDNPINASDQAMASIYSSSSSASVPAFATITLGEISQLHECNGSEVRTYLALALHAGADGDCWPGRRRLAGITGQSRENVSRATRGLEAAGLIHKEVTPSGRLIYHLPLHRRPSATGAVSDGIPPGIELDTPPVANSTPIEQTIEQITEREPAPLPAPAPVAEPLSQDLRKIKTAAPDGVPQAWIEVGQALRPELPVEVIRNSAEVFLDHHRSKATVLTDWLPAFRVWIRRERAPKAPPCAHKPLTSPTVPAPYVEPPEVSKARFEARMKELGAIQQADGTWARPTAAVPVPMAAAPASPSARVTPTPVTAPRLTAEQTRRLAEMAAAGISPREVAAALAGRV